MNCMTVNLKIDGIPDDINRGDVIVLRLDLENHTLHYWGNFGSDIKNAIHCVEELPRSFTVVANDDYSAGEKLIKGKIDNG